ncbi:MAG TPA: glycosyltransferase family A protein [Burkholderiales bacterium]
MTNRVDVLVATYRRPAALAVLLTSLCAQTFRDFRLVVSDQSDESAFDADEVRAALRVLRTHGHPLEIHRHLPRRGLAEHRQFLLDRAQAPCVLFLDDDLILEPDVLALLVHAMERERCGFLGQAVIGLSYVDDVRPHEQAIEPWDGPIAPEAVAPGTRAWERHRLHNAANLYHVQQRLALPPGRYLAYRIAWIGGCVMYDTAKLRAAGGFGFWRELPPAHCGEDVLAQLRVMARYGGGGILPSGVYHQELPTTVADRRIDAPHVLGLDRGTLHGPC